MTSLVFGLFCFCIATMSTLEQVCLESKLFGMLSHLGLSFPREAEISSMQVISLAFRPPTKGGILEVTTQLQVLN